MRKPAHPSRPCCRPRRLDPARSAGLRPQDIIEKFVRSGGKGGQNVNKTATCVYLKHRPTGIEVKYQRERSQARNREEAYRVLAGKVAGAAELLRQERRQVVEKERRRKRPRPAGLKERILEAKKRTGEKKRKRGKRFEE